MKILNIGSCNIDYTYSVDHFIQPGETNSCISMNIGCGGKGLNQSIALAKAGTPIYHGGIVGKEGVFLKEKLEEFGVNTDFVEVTPSPNGHAIIQVDKTAQNCILLFSGTNHQFSEQYIDKILSAFDKGDILVLQNEINNIPYIINQASNKGLRIAFNAAPYNDTVREYPLDKVEWLIINEVEGAGLADSDDPAQIIPRLKSIYPSSKILLTLGTQGCRYFDGTEEYSMPSCKVDAVDTTAAGDTFIGYFMRGISDGLPVSETLRLATVASAIAVTRKGAADSVPSYSEVVSSKLYQEFSC